MPLIKQGKVIRDPWTFVADDETMPDASPTMLSLERWKAARGELAGRNTPVGIRLRSDQGPEEIADDVHRFDVIALEFPTFKDGRAYSSARLLRDRYGYGGELRAVGNVLRDQLMFMVRCGFDSFELDKDEDAGSWTGAIDEIDVVYQSASDDRTPVPALRQRGIIGAWAY